MKVKDLIKELESYDGNVDVVFKLIPNDGTEEDTDQLDQLINCVGEIYSGGLEEGGALPPYVEVGFQLPQGQSKVDFKKLAKDFGFK